jgi:hypothetical protein
MKLVSKVSVKTVFGKIKTNLVEVTNVVDGVTTVDKKLRASEHGVMRVIGESRGYKTGNTAFGEFVSFTGQFRATNMETGEVFDGPNLFLPDVATGLMRAQHDNSDGPIQFAFDIGVKPADTPHGYEYTVTPLMAPSESDPLAVLSAKLLASAPALVFSKAPAASAIAAPAETATADVAETEAPAVDQKKRK